MKHFVVSLFDLFLGALFLVNNSYGMLINYFTHRGLLPHCLSILKICRNLTEKLVGMTMGNSPNIRTPETLTDIVSIAKRINPRVDEVVQSISPPLDPRLLEAR